MGEGIEKAATQGMTRVGEAIGERRGAVWGGVSQSPLGWFGENATAHYMPCLCPVDEQCAIRPRLHRDAGNNNVVPMPGMVWRCEFTPPKAEEGEEIEEYLEHGVSA